MRPLKVLAYQRKKDMDFVADCVLDILSDFPKATLTQTIVDECSKDKVASPATTHKKLAQLKQLGLVEDYAHPHDNDGRKRYIKISADGLKYLNGWEAVSK